MIIYVTNLTGAKLTVIGLPGDLNAGSAEQPFSNLPASFFDRSGGVCPMEKIRDAARLGGPRDFRRRRRVRRGCRPDVRRRRGPDRPAGRLEPQRGHDRGRGHTHAGRGRRRGLHGPHGRSPDAHHPLHHLSLGQVRTSSRPTQSPLVTTRRAHPLSPARVLPVQRRP